MDKVRFAVAGCGFIGALHARVIRGIPSAEVTAVLDTTAKKAEKMAAEYNCAWYTRAEDMLADPNVDAVAICLPSGLHQELTILAARAGKHVICEKPMDIRLDSARAMIKACRENQVRLGIIMQHRFDEPVQLLKKAIREGWMGRLL